MAEARDRLGRRIDLPGELPESVEQRVVAGRRQVAFEVVRVGLDAWLAFVLGRTERVEGKADLAHGDVLEVVAALGVGRSDARDGALDRGTALALLHAKQDCIARTMGTWPS